MHAPSRGASAGHGPPIADTSIAAVFRELNTRALRSARWLGPAGSAAALVGHVTTRNPAFLGLGALGLGLWVIAQQRLRRGTAQAELVLLVAGVGVVMAWPLAPDLVRGGLSAVLLVLAMFALLILPAPARRRAVSVFVLLIAAQLIWPLLGMADAIHAAAHVAVSFVVLAAGAYAAWAVRTALERSERTRLEVFRRVPIGLVRLSRSGNLIEVNPAFAAMLGYRTDELLDRPIADLYEDPGQLMQLANKLGVATEPQRYAHRLRRRDGSTMWVRGFVQPVRDEANAILYHEAAVEDVTQRREIEEASRINAARFRNVFERAPVAIWEEDWSGVATRLEKLRALGVDDIAAYLRSNPDEFMRLWEQVRYLDVNQAGLDLVAARTKEEAFANTRPEPPPSAIADSFIEEFVAVWEGIDQRTIEAVGHRADGKPLHMSISWAASRTPQGELDLSHVIVTMIDISGIKRAERELERLVASKDDLIASVSHELRTPITTIMGMAFELRDRTNAFSPGEIEELVAHVADQSRELSNIVDDLLVAARSDLEALAVRPERLDLSREVEQIVAGSLVDPVIDIPHHLVAWADPLRFRQIIRNLLTNARRYGGETVSIGALEDDDAIVVSVVDDGQGVRPGDEESIFLPYVRSERDDALPGSLGLGLPVSRRLARLMGGELTYRFDGGSVFELRLPKVKDPVSAA